MSGLKETASAAALAVGLLAYPPAASAQTPHPNIAKACDGYGGWTQKNDGLELVRDIFGDPSGGSVRRLDARLGLPGFNACDAALSIVPETHWRRRVSLLQAKAMHRLALDDAEGALADLDLAVAAGRGPADAYYLRSQAVSGKLIRAFALRRTGQPKAATDLAVEAWRTRPYVRKTAFAAFLAMGKGADHSQIEVILRGAARLSPGVSGNLFWSAMEARRFDEAAALYRSMAPPRDYPDEPATSATRARVALENQVKAERFWAENAGPYAYTLAATGKPEEARTVLANARERLDGAVKDIAQPRPGPKGKADPLAAVRLEHSAALAKDGREDLKEWHRMVDRRIKAANGQADEVLESMHIYRVPKSPITIDLLDALLANLPPGYEAAGPALEKLRDAMDTSESKEGQDDLKDLFDSLPDPETPRRVTRYGKKANFWMGNANAYRIDKRDGEAFSVTFFGNVGSPSMVEELALLYAADHALRAGKDGLILTGRRDFQHTTHVSNYGVVFTSYASGADARLDILPVNSGALPPGYEEAGWRVIDARTIYDTLGPFYDAPVQPSGR